MFCVKILKVLGAEEERFCGTFLVLKIGVQFQLQMYSRMEDLERRATLFSIEKNFERTKKARFKGTREFEIIKMVFNYK